MPTIAEQVGKFEPLLSFRFRLFFDEIGGSPLQSSEQCEISVVSAVLPNESSEEIEVKAGGEVVYYAGGIKYENMEVVCRDSVDAAVYSFLKTWRRKVLDETTGLRGYKRNYAGTARIQQYDPLEVVVKEWKLMGIWPQAINSNTADNDSNDQMKINATFRYDKAIATIM